MIIRSQTFESAICKMATLKLSANAFKMLAICLLLPDTWYFRRNDLTNRCRFNSVNTTSRTLNELKQAGFARGNFQVGVTIYDCSQNENTEIPRIDCDYTCSQKMISYDPNMVSCSQKTSIPDLPKESKFDRELSFFDSDDQILIPIKTTLNKQPTTTRKTRREPAIAEDTATAQQPERKPQPEPEQPIITTQLNAGNIRGLVDFSEPRAAKIRETVSRILWCRGLRSDVIDRAAGGAVLGLTGFTIREFNRIATESRQKAREGTKEAWQTVNLRIMQLYESQSPAWHYSATKTGMELPPKPVEPQEQQTEQNEAGCCEYESLIAKTGITLEDDSTSRQHKIKIARPNTPHSQLQILATGVGIYLRRRSKCAEMVH